MGRYVLKRLLWIIPVTLGIAIFMFSLMYIVPGSRIAGMSYFEQLFGYLKDVFLRLDFGKSFVSNRNISEELLFRFPRTAFLAGFCILLSIGVGVPLGMLAATHPNSWLDSICISLALLGVSIPSFWVALILVIVFSLNLGWLPATGIGGIEYYILPAIANSFAGIASQARHTRASMIEALQMDYIPTARAKGLTERTTVFKHALPNALMPMITTAFIDFGNLLGGTLVIELVFSIPGLGTYLFDAFSVRDHRAVTATIIVLSFFVSLLMLAIDVLYAFVNPQIRSQYVSNRPVRG